MNTDAFNDAFMWILIVPVIYTAYIASLFIKGWTATEKDKLVLRARIKKTIWMTLIPMGLFLLFSYDNNEDISQVNEIVLFAFMLVAGSIMLCTPTALVTGLILSWKPYLKPLFAASPRNQYRIQSDDDCADALSASKSYLLKKKAAKESKRWAAEEENQRNNNDEETYQDDVDFVAAYNAGLYD